jgi:DNA processing protein
MNERGLLDLIISLVPGLMPVEKISLMGEFDNEEEFVAQFRKGAKEFLKRELKVDWDMDEIRERAQSIENVCVMRSIEWVSHESASFPPQLREMYDPPPVIFYRGRLPNPEKSILGMVGTRRPSPEALAQAYSIACCMGQAGISVVSGLALGIDAMSHRGNLSGGVPGYAILGSGVDEIYPSTNRGLAKRILDSGGALISEYPPGTPPARWNFPARNRIISAMSRGVLIVEAPQKSGALITAAFALEQGRDLWVASSGVQKGQHGALYEKDGTVKLAHDGAEIVFSAHDILKKWNIQTVNYDVDTAIPSWDASGRELAASLANFLGIEL